MPWAVDELEHQRHRHALEPAVLERKGLGAAELQPDAGRHLSARDLDHLRLGIDAPHLARVLLDQNGREPAGAAADVEHAPAAQVALAHQEVDELRPVLTDVAELVVARALCRPKSTSGVGDELIRFRHRLDRLLGGQEERCGHEHLHRNVVGRTRWWSTAGSSSESIPASRKMASSSSASVTSPAIAT
jgi:hypothetical protein